MLTCHMGTVDRLFISRDSSLKNEATHHPPFFSILLAQPGHSFEIFPTTSSLAWISCARRIRSRISPLLGPSLPCMPDGVGKDRIRSHSSHDTSACQSDL